MCGLVDNKKDGVSEESEMQSEFLFLCVKDEKRRKKINEKRYHKSYLMQIFNYNIIMYEKQYRF